MHVVLNLSDAGSTPQPAIACVEHNKPQGDGYQQDETTLHDTELFIRRAFDTDSQKGCELLFRL